VSSGSESLEVEALLSRIAEEGRLDSVGQFTLDGTFLREKLSRYRLSNPWLYLGYAVRAGVAGGAPKITMDDRTDFSCTTVILPMQPLDVRALARLSKSTLVDPRDSVLNYVALAFEAAMALKGAIRYVEVSSGYPGQVSPYLRATGSEIVRATGKEIVLGQKLWEFEEPGLRIQVAYPWWKLLWNAFMEGWHTAMCFDHMGVPLIWQGELKNAPLGVKDLDRSGTLPAVGSWKAPGSREHPLLVALAPGWQPGLIPYAGSDGKAAHLWLLCSQPGSLPQPCSREAGCPVPWILVDNLPVVGAWAILWDRPGITWILHGVEIETESWPERDDSPVGALVVADGLQVDLGGSRLIRDQAYQERLAWLELLLKLYHQPPVPG